jgi:hypothetical protein
VSGETANHVYRQLGAVQDKLRQAQNELVELRAHLAALGLEDSTLDGQERRRRTGYRMVRGSHGATYVRDPMGTDPLPLGYTIPKGAV